MIRRGFTILLTLLMSMMGVEVFAHDIEVANADGKTIYYTYINNATELAVSYRGGSYSSYSNEYSGNIVIPETVTYNGKTYSVTSIESYAFFACSGLTSVTIPNSVTSVGERAFSDCSALTEVNYNATNCTYMGSSSYPVFYECSSLTTLNIGNNVQSIPSYAFSGCSRLTSVTIPNSVTSIGNSAFEGCSGLTSVTIGTSVTSIGSGAFNGSCSGMTSIKVPATDFSAFCRVVSLVKSNIGKPIIMIDADDNEITDYSIPKGVNSIDDYSFYNCSGLKSVTIPNSVTSIGKSAFEQCNSLESVTIGTGVLSLGSSIFSSHRPAKVIWLTNTPPSGYSNASGTTNYVANDLYTSLSNKTVYKYLSSMFEVDGVKYVPVSPSERTCDAIDCLYDMNAESIYIGETVTNAGITLKVNRVHPYACYGNPYIKGVQLDLKGDVANYAFYNCGNITTATIANTGTIGNYAFSSCTALQTATLGEKVTGLGACAFSGCSKLEGIVIPNSVTSIGKSGMQIFQYSLQSSV